MRVRVALLTAMVAAVIAVAPAIAITNGQPDGREHPYVGELLFYDPDAPSSVFADPGGWFTCTGTLVSSTVVLTAGHCTFGVGLDGDSTTAGLGDGDGGNDIWIDFSEAAHFEGFPPTANFTTQQARYEARVAWLNASGHWQRARRTRTRSSTTAPSTCMTRASSSSTRPSRCQSTAGSPA